MEEEPRGGDGQDGQGHCMPEAEAAAMSQEAPGWGLPVVLGVAGVRAARLPFTIPAPSS